MKHYFCEKIKPMGIKYLNMNKQKLNVAVIGSRSFDDYGLLSRFIITRILPKRLHCIISGGAKGQIHLQNDSRRNIIVKSKSFLPNGVYIGLKPDISVITI